MGAGPFGPQQRHEGAGERPRRCAQGSIRCCARASMIELITVATLIKKLNSSIDISPFRGLLSHGLANR